MCVKLVSSALSGVKKGKPSGEYNDRKRSIRGSKVETTPSDKRAHDQWGKGTIKRKHQALIRGLITPEDVFGGGGVIEPKDPSFSFVL